MPLFVRCGIVELAEVVLDAAGNDDQEQPGSLAVARAGGSPRLPRVAGHSTPATTLLDRQRVAHTVHSYDHDPRSSSYGAEASEALGVPAERVFKTLVADVDGRLTVAVVPVACQLDLKALAAAAGGKKAALADVTAAERATGYVAGGISPLGQRKRLPVIVDASALDLATIFCSAGRRGLQIELAPADLIRAANAAVARIAQPQPQPH